MDIISKLPKVTESFEAFLKDVKLIGPNGLPIERRGFFSVGNGWLPLMVELIMKMIDAGWNKRTLQVKEKFGGLRFYIGLGNDRIWELLEEYEDKSFETCESCGAPGKVVQRYGWLATMCNECSDHLGYKE